MDCFKKNIIRLVFSSTLILLLFSVLAIGNASAAAAYRDDLPVPFSQIVWDHTDVSGWVINSDLHKVYISGGCLNMPHTKACDWPMYDRAVNANAWVIHKSTRDGKWHANTWDFMRKCQTTKGEDDVGDPYGWRPSHNEEVYILMSGIARPGYTETTHARSNIVKYSWGNGVGTALPACTEAPIISSFAAKPSSPIRPGETTKLVWDVVGAEGLELTTDNDDVRDAFAGTYDPDDGGVGDVPLEKTTTFTLNASNDCGAATPKSVTVLVTVELPFLDSLVLYPGAEVTSKKVDWSRIGEASATMCGEVSTPHGREATLSFEYGETTAYGSQVSGDPTKATGSNVPFEGIASGLTAGTTYHYRAKGVLKNKIAYGVDKTFITDNIPDAETRQQ